METELYHRKKIKVMHLMLFCLNGGIENLVKNYCINLDKNKFDPFVAFVFIPYETSTLKYFRDNGIRYRQILNYSYVNRGLERLNIENYKALKIRKVILEEKPDIIHVHHELLRSVKKALDGVPFQVQVIYTCHLMPSLYFSGKNKHEVDAALSLIGKSNLQIISLHKDMRKELCKLFPKKNVKLLYNGVDCAKYSHGTIPRNKMRKRLNIPNDAYVVGNIGRLSRIKNQMFLIDVFAEVKKRNNNAFLLIVGDGPDKKLIDKKLSDLNLSDSVLIISNRTDIPDLLAIMDCFVMTSLEEGFSLSLIEAQVAKVKCVVSDCNRPETILNNNVTRLSLDNSIDLWAKSILKKDKFKYGKTADFDIKNLTKKLEKIYYKSLKDLYS